jgi:hypothetical protein
MKGFGFIEFWFTGSETPARSGKSSSSFVLAFQVGAIRELMLWV